MVSAPDCGSGDGSSILPDKERESKVTKSLRGKDRRSMGAAKVLKIMFAELNVGAGVPQIVAVNEAQEA
jgi:hypothetical protein